MKKFFLITAVLIIFIVPSANAANWIWIYSDEDYSIWVDNNSITKGNSYSSYNFKAFVKWNYSESGKQKLIEFRRKSGLNLPDDISINFHT